MALDPKIASIKAAGTYRLNLTKVRLLVFLQIRPD